ncbi:hypothetical protein D9M72_132750 [compost metagenome]|jgi:prophage regulatory protein
MQNPVPTFLRAKQILGDKKKGISPIFPVSHTTWWNGVKSGRFPQPVRFGKRMTMWRAADIYRLIEQGAA